MNSNLLDFYWKHYRNYCVNGLSEYLDFNNKSTFSICAALATIMYKLFLHSEVLVSPGENSVSECTRTRTYTCSCIMQ